MAAEIEEIVVDAYWTRPQHLFPDLRELDLELISGRRKPFSEFHSGLRRLWQSRTIELAVRRQWKRIDSDEC
jgi:hypothetical protein